MALGTYALGQEGEVCEADLLFSVQAHRLKLRSGPIRLKHLVTVPEDSMVLAAPRPSCKVSAVVSGDSFLKQYVSSCTMVPQAIESIHTGQSKATEGVMSLIPFSHRSISFIGHGDLQLLRGRPARPFAHWYGICHLSKETAHLSGPTGACAPENKCKRLMESMCALRENPVPDRYGQQLDRGDHLSPSCRMNFHNDIPGWRRP